MKWLAVAPALALACAPLVARAQEDTAALTFDQIDRTSIAAPIDADSTFVRDYRRWTEARDKGEILSQHALGERVATYLRKDASAKFAKARASIALGLAANALDQAGFMTRMVPGLSVVSGVLSGGELNLQSIASLIPGPAGMVARTVLSFLPAKFKTVHFGPNLSSLAGVPVAQLEGPLQNEERLGRLTHYTIAGDDVRIDDPLGEVAILAVPDRGKVYRLDLLQKTYDSYDVPPGENPLAFLTGGTQPAAASLLVDDRIDGAAGASTQTGGVSTQHYDVREQLSVKPAGKCDQDAADVAFVRSDEVAAFAGPPVLPFYPFDSSFGSACGVARYAVSGSANYGSRFVVNSRAEMHSGSYTLTTLTERGNVAHPPVASVRGLFQIPAGFRAAGQERHA